MRRRATHVPRSLEQRNKNAEDNNSTEALLVLRFCLLCYGFGRLPDAYACWEAGELENRASGNTPKREKLKSQARLALRFEVRKTLQIPPKSELHHCEKPRRRQALEGSGSWEPPKKVV